MLNRHVSKRFLTPAFGAFLGIVPLQPVESQPQLLDVLANAPIVATKTLSDGINKPLKLTLERDGVRSHAIFRQVQERYDERSARIGARDRYFSDCYIYEVAAYELAQMLGLDSVPAAVLRKIDGREGSVQTWVENATSEARRMERGLQPEDPARWQRQKQGMYVFDNLIYNFDRNPGNMLLDEGGKLWLVDHTRSFKRLPALPEPEKLASMERGLWQRLLALDPEAVRTRLRPYLDGAELGALLKRRELLIEHFERLIEEKGEAGVFFDSSDGG